MPPGARLANADIFRKCLRSSQVAMTCAANFQGPHTHTHTHTTVARYHCSRAQRLHQGFRQQSDPTHIITTLPPSLPPSLPGSLSVIAPSLLARFAMRANLTCASRSDLLLKLSRQFAHKGRALHFSVRQRCLVVEPGKHLRCPVMCCVVTPLVMIRPGQKQRKMAVVMICVSALP